MLPLPVAALGAMAVFLVGCNAIADDGNPLIKPKQLMMGTVVDTTNAEIVRDAFLMMKSMRYFGATWNDATLVVGITGQPGSNEDNSVIARVAALGAQIVFIPQSTAGHAKTLNKFRLFEAFDSTSYDYFLWLDADLVVFQDPMPFFHLHQYPGSVECVPDFYSYLRRYPNVNTSTEYWNAAQPSFHLLGDGETAPHGLCNTGVLYFDSLSLAKFNSGLQAVLSNTTYMNLHGSDRFVDSLIFTQVVNTLGIEVTVLPHALNYMALFEIEIQEELLPHDIVMAHMLSDTELYCTISTSTTTSIPDEAVGDCTCVYRNKLMSPTGSTLRETIQDKILSRPEVCRMLAGDAVPAALSGQNQPPPTNCAVDVSLLGDALRTAGLQSADGAYIDAHSGIMDQPCTIVSPPAQHVTLHVGADGVAQLNVLLYCSHAVTRAVNTVYDATSTVVHTSDASVSAHDGGEEGQAEHELAYTIEFTPTAPSNGPDYAAHHTLVISTGALQPYIIAAANLTILFDHRIPPAQVHYSLNPALTPKPTALDSQLFLAEYLNDRHVRGTGVAECCSTHKGVATVERLIQRWEGDHLLILINDVPALPALNTEAGGAINSTDVRAALQHRLHSVCQQANVSRQRLLNCFVVVPPVADTGDHRSNADPFFVRQIAHALRPRSLQFVYLDGHRRPHCEHVAALRAWMRALTKQGLLMSSHYGSAKRPHFSLADPRSTDVGMIVSNGTSVTARTSPAPSASNPPILHHIRRNIATHLTHARFAADTLAAELRQHFQFTFAERDPSFCAAFVRSHDVELQQRRKGQPITADQEWAALAESWECSPAWYIHKLRGN
jgi:hypothetical protein